MCIEHILSEHFKILFIQSFFIKNNRRQKLKKGKRIENARKEIERKRRKMKQ